jgi:CRISPR/Cas system-associated protein Cas10 (large subunit of type III CRISPR-Cas system)
MRVCATEINLSDQVNRIKARNMPKRVRTPNCTHLDMDRVYGRDQLCYVCGREPPIGFLYQCKQDCHTQSLHDILEQENDCQIEVVKSDTRLQLEWAGLSESIILTAEKGHYTAEQLEKLKAQKRELRQIISDQLQASQINIAAARLAAMAHHPSNNDGAFGSSLTKQAVGDLDSMLSLHPFL